MSKTREPVRFLAAVKFGIDNLKGAVKILGITPHLFFGGTIPVVASHFQQVRNPPLSFNRDKESNQTDSLTTTSKMFEVSRSNENQDKNRQSIFERLIDGKFLPSDNLTVEMSKSSLSSSMMNSENQNNEQQSSGRSGICL